jgi:glucose/arabinose dehydrogenase
MKVKLILPIIIILSILLSGCGIMNIFHKNVEYTPAPTSIPLPTRETEESSSATPIDAPESTDQPATEQSPRVIVPPQENIALPDGFGISVFQSGLSGPRMMAVGPDNQLYVAERGNGRIIRLPDRDQDGVSDGIEVVAEDLLEPSSLAFYEDGSIYIGETTRVVRVSDPDGDGYFQERQIIIAGIPAGGHTTRTVIFSPDYKHLYVSIGSSCNVCEERDQRRASVVRYKPDGSDEYHYATGLRNAVGLAYHPKDDRLYASNNGRDWLGDDLPPETIYALYTEINAGWPECHAGRIIDPDFGNADSCEGVQSPKAEIQAHSAPLGITFYTGDQFPEEYKNNIFVALHGSWNRTEPVGYSVVRIKQQGGGLWPVIDFATGWLREDGSNWGRPVDLVNAPDGGLFMSDDGEGNIYYIFYSGTDN